MYQAAKFIHILSCLGTQVDDTGGLEFKKLLQSQTKFDHFNELLALLFQPCL